MDYMFVSLQNPYVEALIFNEMTVQDGVFGR